MRREYREERVLNTNTCRIARAPEAKNLYLFLRGDEKSKCKTVWAYYGTQELSDG